MKKKSLLHYWSNLLHYREVLHYWLILLHYREVLHYREFITLLERNIIIDIFQDIPLDSMTAILKIGIRISLGILKVIYHPLYGKNNNVLIWGDWLSCDSLRESHDSQSSHLRKHLCPIL